MKSTGFLFTYLFLLLFSIQLKAQHSDIYLIKSPVNNLVMEAKNDKTGREGSRVFLNAYNGKDTQKWKITQKDNTYYTIVNLANGKDMSVLVSGQSKEGNPFFPNSPKSVELREWSMLKRFTTGNIIFHRYKDEKVLVPDNNRYTNATPVVLKRSDGKTEEWVLIPLD